MNMGIANQFVITGLSLDHGSLDWGPGVSETIHGTMACSITQITSTYFALTLNMQICQRKCTAFMSG